MSPEDDFDRSVPPRNAEAAKQLAQIQRLNASLAGIEKRLQADPARIQFTADVGSRPVDRITFARSGDLWLLTADLVDDNGNGQGRKTLAEMSVVEKAELGKALPYFLRDYLAEQNRRMQLVIEANEALADFVKSMEGA